MDDDDDDADEDDGDGRKNFKIEFRSFYTAIVSRNAVQFYYV